MSHQITNMPAFLRGCQAVLDIDKAKLNSAHTKTIVELLTNASHWSVGWMAYGLATAWHEARFIPQDEWGKGRGRAYGKPGKHGGQVPHGRSLVQLTWDVGYEWADDALADAGILPRGALLKNFDLANRADIATFILVKGMEEGQFTKGGRSLRKYITSPNGTHAEFVQARRIINALDKADHIATEADGFASALLMGGW